MLGIAAQVSLYPLRSARLSPAIQRAAEIFRERGLDVHPGSMSTIVSGDDEAVFDALRRAFAAVAGEGQDVVMVVTFSNACPMPIPPADKREHA